MCVGIAKKCRLKGTGKEKWFLYKVRDRNYSPIYEVEVRNAKGAQTLFLTDQESGWKEGINDKGIMIVSMALDNHADVDANGTSDKTKGSIARTNKTHKLLENALTMTKIDNIVKTLTDGLFQGTTFISDGDNLTILEIYLRQSAHDREVEKYPEEEMEKLSMAAQWDKVYLGITKDDYDIKSQPIKEDRLVVRTNHGKLLKDAGYTPDETEGYLSSTKRYDYVWNALEKIEDPHPMDILSVVSNLTDKDKVKQNNPIRPQEKLDAEDRKEDGPIYKYYTSSILMLSSTGKIFLVPMSSEVDEKSKLKLKPDRDVDLIVLPKNMALFESKKTSGFRKYTAKKMKEKYLK